jgi:ligand-binding sensor domain-containing protein
MLKSLTSTLVIIIFSLQIHAQSWILYNQSNSGLASDRIFTIAVNQSDVKYIPADFSVGVSTFNNTSWSLDTNLFAKEPFTNIIVDQNNHIWANDIWNHGLSEFDGIAWQSYTTSTSSIPTNAIQTVFCDNMNNKWIGTMVGGLLKFNGTTWTQFDTSNSSILTNFVNSISEDSLGNIWLGNRPNWTGTAYVGGGLSKYNGVSFTGFNTSNSGILSNNITNVICDQTNSVWFSSNNILGKFDGTSWFADSSSSSGLPNCTINCLSVDLNNILWIGTDSGLISFDGSTWTTYNTSNSSIPSDTISAIKVDSYDNKWIVFGYMSPVGHYGGNGIAIFNENVIMGPLGISGVQEIQNNDQVLLYPNPSSGNITVRYSLKPSDKGKLVIYDVTGKLIADYLLESSKGQMQVSSDLKNGIYFYQVIVNGGVVKSDKLIIIK